MKYTELNNCLCCNSRNLIQHLDLGLQPLANSYRSQDEKLDEFELRTNLCTECFHLQLSIAVDPDLLFKNYSYVSGTSKTLHSYFEWFSNFVSEQTEIVDSTCVLDIACNDGTQLDYFKSKGFNTYGIDPAENLYSTSSQNHEIYCGYLDDLISKKWSNKFDYIIAQNVFAHNADPLNFLLKMSLMLKTNGRIYIQTSQSEMILNNEFDTIYHEHISFFNVNSMRELSRRVGITLVDVFKTPVHGSSYVFVFQMVSNLCEKINNILAYEKWQGLQTIDTYKFHANNALVTISEFNETIKTYRERGYKIIGYGAAAKGNTILNAAKVYLDIIIDDNDLKWDKYTPGSNSKIDGPHRLVDFYGSNVLFIPLAWNFYTEIMNRMNEHFANFGEVVSFKYFPIRQLVKIK